VGGGGPEYIGERGSRGDVAPLQVILNIRLNISYVTRFFKEYFEHLGKEECSAGKCCWMKLVSTCLKRISYKIYLPGGKRKIMSTEQPLFFSLKRFIRGLFHLEVVTPEHW
jgi:hypothetical protein